jgi:hypothetical protein
MNQRQFDADGRGKFDPEQYHEFAGNPIRQLFDSASRQQSERSYLGYTKDDYEDDLDNETRREIRLIRKLREKK